MDDAPDEPWARVPRRSGLRLDTSGKRPTDLEGSHWRPLRPVNAGYVKRTRSSLAGPARSTRRASCCPVTARMDDSTLMTAADLEDLRLELAQLEGAGRREIAKLIKTPRVGRFKENSEYHDAKNEQAHLETRIATLRSRLARAQVVEIDGLPPATRSLRSIVLVRDEQARASLRARELAGRAPSTGKISIESPSQGRCSAPAGDVARSSFRAARASSRSSRSSARRPAGSSSPTPSGSRQCVVHGLACALLGACTTRARSRRVARTRGTGVDQCPSDAHPARNGSD